MTYEIIRRVWRVSAVLLLTFGVAAPIPAAEPDSRVAKGEAAPSGGNEPPAARSYGIAQVELINQQVRRGWADHELTPSAAAADGEWCRRVFLDILGRIPTVEELDAFVADYAPDKKARLVDRLISDEYVDEYASNWATLWTNILIGRSGGTERMTRTIATA